MPSSFNASNSTVSGDMQVTGNLDVSGTIKSYKFETITYDNSTYLGSTVFGNNSVDTHTFKGKVSGSGDATFVGGIFTEGALQASGAVKLPHATVLMEGLASGSRAGASSFVAVNSQGALVLDSPDGAGTTSLTLNNGASNRVLTSDDGETMNGEANITFDGSSLKIDGTISGSGTATFVGNVFTEGTLYASGSSHAIVGNGIESQGVFSGSGDATFVGDIHTEGDVNISGALNLQGGNTSLSRPFAGFGSNMLYISSSQPGGITLGVDSGIAIGLGQRSLSGGTPLNDETELRFLLNSDSNSDIRLRAMSGSIGPDNGTGGIAQTRAIPKLRISGSKGKFGGTVEIALTSGSLITFDGAGSSIYKTPSGLKISSDILILGGNDGGVRFNNHASGAQGATFGGKIVGEANIASSGSIILNQDKSLQFDGGDNVIKITNNGGGALGFGGPLFTFNNDVSSSARGTFVTGLITAGNVSTSGSVILNQDQTLQFDGGSNVIKISNNGGGALGFGGPLFTFNNDVSSSARGTFVTGLITAGPLNVTGTAILAGQVTASVSVSASNLQVCANAVNYGRVIIGRNHKHHGHFITHETDGSFNIFSGSTSGQINNNLFRISGAAGTTGDSVGPASLHTKIGIGDYYQGGGEPTEMLDIKQNIRIRGIGSNSSAGALHYDSNGVLTTNTSDARLKTNIIGIEDAIGKVKAIRPVYYNWIDTPDGPQRMGAIAQEIETVLPDLVFIGGAWSNKENQHKGVHADQVPWLLAKAIQEQQETIEALMARVAQLESGSA